MRNTLLRVGVVMPNILCNDCDKTFKTQTGLEWHLDRTHEIKPDEPEVDIGASAEVVDEDDSLRNRVESLEAQVEVLLGLGENLSRLIVLQDQVVNLDERYRGLSDLQQKQWGEQSLRAQTIERGLSEVKLNALTGAAARRDVITLAAFVKEEVIPALGEHSHEPLLVIYPDQETIDKLPRCVCGNVRKEDRRTCGRYQCVANALKVSG